MTLAPSFSTDFTDDADALLDGAGGLHKNTNGAAHRAGKSHTTQSIPAGHAHGAAPSNLPGITPFATPAAAGVASDQPSAISDTQTESLADLATDTLGDAFSSEFAQGTAPKTVAAAATSTVAVTTGGITFDLIFDAAAMAAPASFRAGIQQAATILANAITDKITVNLHIDYSGTGGGAAAGPDSGYYVGLSTVDAALAKVAGAGDKTFASLPTGTSVQGQAQVAVWNAQMKALGLMSANSTTTDDGSAYFSTDINPNLLVGVALHELTHALGRVPYGSAPDIFDLFRYTAPGVRLFNGGQTAPAAYFSVDGGVTKLADFGQNSDPSDFLNSGIQGANDPFNEYYSGGTSQVLSAVDLELIHALGFHVPTATIPDTRPDLAISALSVSGNTVSFTLTNTGKSAAAASTTGLYLTNAATPTTASTLLGTFNAASLQAGGSQAESISLAVPTTLAAGTYHIAAIADTKNVVAESNETNNTSNIATLIMGGAGNDTLSGAGAIMYGGAGNDTLKSTGGNNLMYGGAGADTLVGGTGNDEFLYNLASEGLDQIQNFHAGDMFDFAVQGFGSKLATGGANTGTLDASHFIANATGALTAAQEFWFNTLNQTLYYNPQGSTSHTNQVAIAHLTNTYVLHASDIRMV